MRYVGGKFDQHMIEERDTALYGGSHAHVVLFHEQFDQVGFYVGVKQTLQHFARGAVPVLKCALVWRSGFHFGSEVIRKNGMLFLLAKSTQEIIEVQRCPGISISRQRCVC